MSITLDPSNPFEAALVDMVAMHRRKNADYTGRDHPNQNFYDTAYQVGGTAGHSVESLISTKQARLRVLLPKHWHGHGGPLNEGIRDSILDRAVYAVIALTIWDEGGYEEEL